jgi:hypothetical protein
MSIQSYIENLKTKPEHVRKQYAFWYSFGITAVIFVFWLGSFGNVGVGAKSTIATAVNNAGTPGQSMVAGVGAFGKDIWEIITGPKKVTYSEVIVTPGNK